MEQPGNLEPRPATGPGWRGRLARPRAAAALAGGVTIVALAAFALVGGILGSPGPSGASASPAASPSPVALASPSPAPSPTSATPTPSPTAPAPSLVPDPLTGLLVTPAQAQLPVIAVMIDDHSAARPQAGFNAAAVVWQAPAEGGIPRYMMLFHATVPAAVGPVRSAREYFVEWAAEWRAMYTHAGGSPQALQTLRNRGSGVWIWNADEFAWGSYFHRVDFNVAPHNLYTDGLNLEALARKLGVAAPAAKPHWAFRADAPVEARPIGGSLSVSYPTETITYRYDWRTNTYRRYIQGSKVAQVDAGNGLIVAPKNVVILRMAFGPLNDGHPAKHRLEANNVGHGTAWISTNGRTIKGTWKKASVLAPTLLYGPDGKQVTLTAGQTFVEVMKLDDVISIRAGRVLAEPPLDPTGLTPQ